MGTKTQAATPSAVTILQKMVQANRTVSYSAKQTTWRKQTPPIVTQIWDNGRKQYMEYLSPAVNKGDVRIDDGTNVRRYHHSENSVVQTSSSHRTAVDIARFNKNYTVKYLGAATVAGRKTWIIGVMSRENSQYVRKYWVDQFNYLQLRAEYLGADGERSETIQLSDVHFGAVPATRFDWKAPASAKVNYAGELYSHLNYAQKKISWLKVPRQLPTGYAFESVVINKADNEAWLRYSNGTRRFSIFEQRTNDKSTSKPQGISGGWYWKNGGIRFLIAGLSAVDAKRLANSF